MFTSIVQTYNTNFDYLFLGANSTHTGVAGQVGKVFKFNERVNYRTLVHDAYKQYVYSLSAINIVSDEFVTSWTINKSLHKLIHNHLLFRDNTLFKFEGTYDEVGRLQFTKSRHILDSDRNLFGYTVGLDNNIGINEPVYAETINRPIRKLYDLQLELVGMCEEVITNKYPYASQVVELK